MFDLRGNIPIAESVLITQVLDYTDTSIVFLCPVTVKKKYGLTEEWSVNKMKSDKSELNANMTSRWMLNKMCLNCPRIL